MLFNYFFAALAVIVANVAAYPAAIFDAVATSNSQSAANYQVTSSKLDAYCELSCTMHSVIRDH